MIVRFSLRGLLAFALAVLSCAAAANAGLIHRYSFNDGAARDSAGSVDGKLKGTAKIADGKLVLENQDKTSGDPAVSYLEFTAPVIPKTGSASLVFWFTAQDTGPFARLVNFGDQEAGEGRAFIYFTPKTADDQARAAITATDAASKTALDSDKLDDGKTHMVAMVIDGTAKKLHVYVDGKEVGTAQDLGDNTLDKVRPVNNWIGRSSFDGDAGLSAQIDEFRVYDQTLSADEIAAINKAGPDALPAAK